MTFVLALGNRDFVLQLSDRRLTIAGGKVVEEESTKAISLKCRSGRFALAYTGLARHGSFNTRDWLTSCLQEVASPDYEILPIVTRLCKKASEDFKNHSILRSIPAKNKRLSVMISGYVDHQIPRMGNILITNFQDIETGADSNEAWSEFKFFSFLVKEEDASNFSFVQRVGAWQVMTSEDEKYLRQMMIDRLDSKVVLKRALAWFREMANRPSAGNTVGKQINSILIFCDRKKVSENSFHTNRAQNVGYYPDELQLYGDGSQFSFKDFTLRPEKNDPERPLFMPQVGRRKPCPCGKPRMFKNCCGRKK